MNRQFFEMLDPMYDKKQKSEKELFCVRVHKVCKEMRKRHAREGTHFIPWSFTKEAELGELCHKEGISIRVPHTILFGNIEQTFLF